MASVSYGFRTNFICLFFYWRLEKSTYRTQRGDRCPVPLHILLCLVFVLPTGKMRRLEIRDICLDVTLGYVHHSCADTWIRSQLHDKIQRKTVIRSTKERQENVSLSAHGERRAPDKQRDICPSLRKDAAHKMRVG